MSPAEPLRIVLRGDDADCGVLAIMLYTGLPYADVMREVLRHDGQGAKDGMTDRVLRRTLEGVGMRVRFTRKVDWDDSYGILSLSDHFVVLKGGQVVEPRATWCAVYDADDYKNSLDPKQSVHGIFLSRSL